MASLAPPFRLVLLKVDGQTYALHLAAVDRVLRMVAITPLPGAPDAVEGVINIQGEVLAIVSIRRRLGLPQRSVAAADSLVVVRAGTRRIAIIAETVLGVAECEAGTVVDCDDLGGGIGHIEGVVKTSDGLALIQDLERFFSAEEHQLLDLAMEGA